ncbi:MAG: hypothetical protein ACR2RF_32160 [Geminicoccaceae bacterium]
MKISLTKPEITQGALVGVMRQISAIALGREQNHGADDFNAWHRHIEGALSEMAVAKAIDRYWSGTVHLIDTADVSGHQVRATQHKNGRLRTHPKDSDNEWFILAVGQFGEYEIKGMLQGWAAKNQKYWCDPTGKNRPAFFAPQEDLHPFDPEVLTDGKVLPA